METSRRVSRFEAGLMAVLFCAAIGAPALKQIFRGEPETVNLENRKPARKPPFSWKRKALNAFPAKFEQYYDDHFGFRSVLLGMGNNLKVRWFHLSPVPEVVIGREDWLYYFQPQTEQVFRGTLRLSEPQLQQWAGALERRRAWLAARGVRYLFVAIPEKQTIYPEFVPARLPRGPGPTPFDQLASYLAEHAPDLAFLDLRPALLSAKSEQRVFLKSDTHWNNLGAFFGSREILRQINRWFPDVTVPALSDFEQRTKRFTGGDLARMTGVPDLVSTDEVTLARRQAVKWVSKPLVLPREAEQKNRKPPFTTISEASGNSRGVMIVRDSFTNQMVPILSRAVGRCSYLWRGRSGDGAYERALVEIVEREKPDLFIDEMVERFFTIIPKEQLVFGGSED